MDLGLSGRVVLVTGGSRGIGKAVAELLVGEGASVAICARHADASARAADELGDRALGRRADVTDDRLVAELVDAVIERFGRLDAVVNNAGRFGGGPVAELSDAGLFEGLDTKTAGMLRVVRHALPHLRESDQARVVNVSGLTALKTTPAAAMTALGNAGVVTLTSYLAHELIADGVLVNAVIPGFTRTGVWEERAAARAESEGTSVDEALEAMLAAQGMDHARWGRPAEIAQVIVFLLSSAASFVNGVALRVDGGQFAAVDY